MLTIKRIKINREFLWIFIVYVASDLWRQINFRKKGRAVDL